MSRQPKLSNIESNGSEWQTHDLNMIELSVSDDEITSMSEKYFFSDEKNNFWLTLYPSMIIISILVLHQYLISNFGNSLEKFVNAVWTL